MFGLPLTPPAWPVYILVLKPDPKRGDIWRWDLWGHRGVGIHEELVPLQSDEEPRGLSFCPTGVRAVGHPQPRGGLSAEPEYTASRP